MFKKSFFILFILLISLLLSNSALSGDPQTCHIKDGTVTFYKSGPKLLASRPVIGNTKVIIERDLFVGEVQDLNNATGLDFNGAKVLLVKKITLYCQFHGSHEYKDINIIVLKKDLICEPILEKGETI